MTMLAQIKEYFQERGVTTSDLPKVILTHELFSVAFLAFTWAACYQIQPSQSPLFAPINKSIQESNNVFIVKSRQSFEGFLTKAERRVSHEWLSKRRVDSGRVAVSLAESTLFRKLAKPVTIPAKLWLTLKFVQSIGGVGKDDDPKDAGERRRQKQPSADEVAVPGRGTAGAKRRGGGDAIVTGRQRGWWERGPVGPAASTGGRRSSGNKAGWEFGRAGRRRKAICPPGRRGGGAPGCFVPTAAGAPGRCFVAALPASSLLRGWPGSSEGARLR